MANISAESLAYVKQKCEDSQHAEKMWLHVAIVEAMIADLEAALALLAELEWVMHNGKDDGDFCPDCGADKRYGRHHHDCRLDALLHPRQYDEGFMIEYR